MSVGDDHSDELSFGIVVRKLNFQNWQMKNSAGVITTLFDSIFMRQRLLLNALSAVPRQCLSLSRPIAHQSQATNDDQQKRTNKSNARTGNMTIVLDLDQCWMEFSGKVQRRAQSIQTRQVKMVRVTKKKKNEPWNTSISMDWNALDVGTFYSSIVCVCVFMMFSGVNFIPFSQKRTMENTMHTKSDVDF